MLPEVKPFFRTTCSFFLVVETKSNRSRIVYCNSRFTRTAARYGHSTQLRCCQYGTPYRCLLL